MLKSSTQPSDVIVFLGSLKCGCEVNKNNRLPQQFNESKKLVGLVILKNSEYASICVRQSKIEEGF